MVGEEDDRGKLLKGPMVLARDVGVKSTDLSEVVEGKDTLVSHDDV